MLPRLRAGSRGLGDDGRHPPRRAQFAKEVRRDPDRAARAAGANLGRSARPVRSRAAAGRLRWHAAPLAAGRHHGPKKPCWPGPVRPFLAPMSPPAPPFTSAERAWLRQELGVHFGAPPHIADGLFLRSWKSGPEKGKPKLPPAAQSMLE